MRWRHAAFGSASGDRPAGREGGVVVELVEVAGEVAMAGVDVVAAGGGEAFGPGLDGHLGGGAFGVSGEGRAPPNASVATRIVSRPRDASTGHQPNASGSCQ